MIILVFYIFIFSSKKQMTLIIPYTPHLELCSITKTEIFQIVCFKSSINHKPIKYIFTLFHSNAYIFLI